jgi:hypothetical protein
MSFLSLLSPVLVFKLVHLLLDLLLSNLFVVSQYANPSLRGRRNTENPLKNVLLLLTTSRQASTAFLAGRKTSSFIFGRNIAHVKIVP